MKIEIINKKEYFDLLKQNNINIPIYSDIEVFDTYPEIECLKVLHNNNEIAVFVYPINNNGVRREYRYYPYHSPILLKELDNIHQKEVYKCIFNYLFNKYDYTFIPLHPSFKVISGISSQNGFVEMRHTHVLESKLELYKVSSKLRNHINSASKNVQIIIDNDYSNYDFNEAIKGSKEEQIKRSNLTKKLLDNNKAITIKTLKDNKVIAGIVVIYDKEWSYLLHSYQKEKVRGVVPLLILNATQYVFDNLKVKYFDFEGSVIDEIDDFFSSFDASITTYPYVIYSKDENEFIKLIKRSMNIEGRIKQYERD